MLPPYVVVRSPHRPRKAQTGSTVRFSDALDVFSAVREPRRVVHRSSRIRTTVIAMIATEATARAVRTLVGSLTSRSNNHCPTGVTMASNSSPTMEPTRTIFHHTYGLATRSRTHKVVVHKVITTAVRSEGSGTVRPPNTRR